MQASGTPCNSPFSIGESSWGLRTGDRGRDVAGYDAGCPSGPTVVAIEVRRVLLKVPAFNRCLRPWRADEEKLLGKVPDKEIARQLKGTLQAVQLRRKRLGIPSPGYRGRAWSKREDHLLGTMLDADLARQSESDSAKHPQSPKGETCETVHPAEPLTVEKIGFSVGQIHSLILSLARQQLRRELSVSAWICAISPSPSCGGAFR